MQVVDIAVKIHKEVGPGLLENIYEKCFCIELSKRNIDYESQKFVPIIYEDVIIEQGLRLDLVSNLLIIELKAQENSHAVWTAQLWSYMKLANKRIGLLSIFMYR